MPKSVSRRRPDLTPDFIRAEGSEGHTFDRKSGAIRARDLAPVLVAFANADGGTVAIGIRNRQIEGIQQYGPGKVNELMQASIDFTVPPVRCEPEIVSVNDWRGLQNSLLLIHVEESDRVHRTVGDEVYLRVGDESRRLSHEERLQLEYDKGDRSFEDQEVDRCKLEDLDSEVLDDYFKVIDYTGSVERFLLARGLAVERKDRTIPTVAAVLLFARLPTTFLPGAKLRFIRYEGTSAETGTRLNIVKNKTLEGPLPKLIPNAFSAVEENLRAFEVLGRDGRFHPVPEYPDFAWREGIVNALVHRAYNMSGLDVQVRMFDDRLEIESPGRLPGLVRLANIREVRYSRNPRIARVLNDFGYVREFGEGVDRIYEEMRLFHLDEPEYSEPGEMAVLLKLKNNIVMRSLRRQRRIGRLVNPEQWETLSMPARQALEFAYARQRVTTKEFAELLDRSRNYARRILDNLVEMGLLVKVGKSRDPNLHYRLNVQEPESKE